MKSAVTRALAGATIAVAAIGAAGCSGESTATDGPTSSGTTSGAQDGPASTETHETSKPCQAYLYDNSASSSKTGPIGQRANPAEQNVTITGLSIHQPKYLVLELAFISRAGSFNSYKGMFNEGNPQLTVYPKKNKSCKGIKVPVKNAQLIEDINLTDSGGGAWLLELKEPLKHDDLDVLSLKWPSAFKGAKGISVTIRSTDKSQILDATQEMTAS